MATTPPALNPTFNDDNPFPSIPTIINGDIRKRVFTHRSLYARLNRGVFEDDSDDPSPDNEKYEFLGDSVLGMVITGLLLEMYPNLHVGSYSKIRALVVWNSTLATISCRYKLPAQLKLHPAQAISLRENFNTQANVFESYVGGLYLDKGLATVEKWLKALLKPYITEAYNLVRAEYSLPSLPSSACPQLTSSTVTSTFAGSSPGIDPTSLAHLHISTPSATGHLAFFNEYLQKEKGKREGKFHDDQVTEGTVLMWESLVEVDGEVFGRGKGHTKKAARNEAARKALIRMGITV